MTLPETLPIGNKAQLARFALASLALHFAALALWLPKPFFMGHQESVLSVTLVAPLDRQNAAAPAQPAPQRVSRMKNRAVHTEADKGTFSRTRHPEETATRAAIQAPARSNVRVTTAVETSSGTRRNSVMARIRARLITDLARNFAYPTIARQRGWQGTVLVGFHVGDDGRLDKIHVARSSGYYVLDKSALDSIGRIGRLAEAKLWLQGRSLDMQLSVIYRLLER